MRRARHHRVPPKYLPWDKGDFTTEFCIPKGVTGLNVTMYGAGGGGGSNSGAGQSGAGGGGAGGVSYPLLSVQPGQVMPVHIGAPGGVISVPHTIPPDEMRCYLALLEVRKSRVWRKLPIEVRTNVTRVLKGG